MNVRHQGRQRVHTLPAIRQRGVAAYSRSTASRALGLKRDVMIVLVEDDVQGVEPLGEARGGSILAIAYGSLATGEVTHDVIGHAELRRHAGPVAIEPELAEPYGQAVLPAAQALLGDALQVTAQGEILHPQAARLAVRQGQEHVAARLVGHAHQRVQQGAVGLLPLPGVKVQAYLRHVVMVVGHYLVHHVPQVAVLLGQELQAHLQVAVAQDARESLPEHVGREAGVTPEGAGAPDAHAPAPLLAVVQDDVAEGVVLMCLVSEVHNGVPGLVVLQGQERHAVGVAYHLAAELVGLPAAPASGRDKHEASPPRQQPVYGVGLLLRASLIEREQLLPVPGYRPYIEGIECELCHLYD